MRGSIEFLIQIFAISCGSVCYERSSLLCICMLLACSLSMFSITETLWVIRPATIKEIGRCAHLPTLSTQPDAAPPIRPHRTRLGLLHARHGGVAAPGPVPPSPACPPPEEPERECDGPSPPRRSPPVCPTPRGGASSSPGRAMAPLPPICPRRRCPPPRLAASTSAAALFLPVRPPPEEPPPRLAPATSTAALFLPRAPSVGGPGTRGRQQ
ncbi:hypothetical protein BS78_02G302100 [Paspalum vaginatum]|nr:hypothetical protein BS78_02G302100 [Paspalum vaginatum]